MNKLYPGAVVINFMTPGIYCINFLLYEISNDIFHIFVIDDDEDVEQYSLATQHLSKHELVSP